MTTTQFSGCTLGRVAPLEEPQRAERDDLNEHHARERPPKPARPVRVVAHRRAHARRAPSAINTPPVTRSSHALTLGRVRTAPSWSTNHAYAVSHTKPIAMWMPARNKLRRNTGSPGPMNCGRKVR